jgi:hypothetical protein
MSPLADTLGHGERRAGVARVVADAADQSALLLEG